MPLIDYWQLKKRGRPELETEAEMVLRLLMAAGMGAIVGYQRERAGKVAGVRTHILICVGSALFTVISIFGFGVGIDTSRVAAGVVAGVGFLGAGAIMRRGEGIVEGLTTAATIWVVAAIGLAAGAGLYLISGVATVIVFGVLFIPHHEE
jgi:putative Mg2+ transporter-C (MgtC) family protein